MQVNVMNEAGGSVKQLGRKCFGERVIPFLLPSRNQVETVFGDHPVELGYLIGAVLEVGIQGDDHFSCGFIKARLKGRRFAVIFRETEAFYFRIFRCQLPDDLPGAVITSVIHEKYFIGKSMVVHNTPDPGMKLLQ
ncbi:hypothetical protein D9M69_644550 [compost metagenome]